MISSLLTDGFEIRVTTSGTDTDRNLVEARLLRPSMVWGRDGSQLHGG